MMEYTLRIKRIQNVPFEYSSGVEIEESRQKSTIIKGVLLSEGISRNGNMYTVDEMRNIASNAVGLPLIFGVNPITNKHAKSEPVGKIVRAHFDEVKRKIFFWAKVTSQKIAESVKKGWRVSIGGIAKSAEYMLDSFGKIVMKLKNLVLNHVQLLTPTTQAGIPDAVVEQVVEESMRFDDKVALSNSQIAAIIAAINGVV